MAESQRLANLTNIRERRCENRSLGLQHLIFKLGTACNGQRFSIRERVGNSEEIRSENA